MAMLLSMAWSALSSSINQVEAVMIKKYNAKYSQGGFVFTALISLFAMVFFFIIDKDGLCFPPRLILYGIISGFFYCFASYLTFVALGCGSYMLSNLFLSYTLIFSIIYGLVFLKEESTLCTYFGIVLMLVSIFLAKNDKIETNGGRQSVKISVKWVVCIILSVICAGMFEVMKKLQQVEFNKAYDNEFMIVTYIFTFAALIITGIIKDKKQIIHIFRHAGPYAATAGASNGMVNLLGLEITKLIPISVGAPMMSGIKIIVTFLISFIVFKETMTVKQTIGIVLGTVSLILFNIKI